MDLTGMIETGGANPVLLFLFALALGALHGLEPGHSKTMMAAYFIAVHGTVKQAVLLGVSAAFSHSIIVWVLAMIALFYGNELIGEELESWFMIVSGVLVLGIAVWMFWQQRRSHGHHHHHHDHDHGHSHSHDHHSHGNVSGLDEAHMDAHARAHDDRRWRPVQRHRIHADRCRARRHPPPSGSPPHRPAGSAASIHRRPLPLQRTAHQDQPQDRR